MYEKLSFGIFPRILIFGGYFAYFCNVQMMVAVISQKDKLVFWKELCPYYIIILLLFTKLTNILKYV